MLRALARPCSAPTQWAGDPRTGALAVSPRFRLGHEVSRSLPYLPRQAEQASPACRIPCSLGVWALTGAAHMPATHVQCFPLRLEISVPHTRLVFIKVGVRGVQRALKPPLPASTVHAPAFSNVFLPPPCLLPLCPSPSPSPSLSLSVCLFPSLVAEP